MTDLLATASTELLRWARAEFGEEVTLGPPKAPMLAGMDTVVGRVTLHGPGVPPTWTEPVVLRVHRGVEREATAEREAAVQTWCDTRGFPVPKILLVGTTKNGFTTPIQVMTTAPGTTLLAALTASTLARPHIARPHGRAPGPAPPSRAGRFSRHPAADGRGEGRDGPVLVRDHRRLRAAGRAGSRRGDGDRTGCGPAAVCHGDYHPLNIMVEGDRLAVLDWTDATVGDPMGDLARSVILFGVARVAADTAALRHVLSAVGPTLSRTYLAAYRSCADVDPVRFAHWRSVHLFHGWAQVRALHAGIIGTDAERARVPSTVTAWLHRQYDRSIA